MSVDVLVVVQLSHIESLKLFLVCDDYNVYFLLMYGYDWHGEAVRPFGG